MTNYLIRHITDSTGHPFVEVIKPRENERYEIVSAESKAEAEEMAKQKQTVFTKEQMHAILNCNTKTPKFK